MQDWDEISRSARILVIDDDRGTLEEMTGMLARGGYRHIWTTDDPARAVEIFRRVQPDLVLMELRMGPIDGLEVLRRLHEEIADEAYVPVIVVTGDASDEAKLNALLLGAKDFITKPFDVVETMLRVRVRLDTRFRFLEMERTIRRLRGHAADESQP